MKINPFTTRNTSIITGNKNLENLYEFKNFPVYMGCTEKNESEDLFADMKWDICTDTGIIQLKELLPLDILYMDQHNDGTGKVWEQHYEEFSKFIYKYKPSNILEIGGAHDKIANYYFDLSANVNWTIVEPNPQYVKNKKIKIIKDWFDNNFSSNEKFDTIIHSHVFEHTYNPIDFINHISKFMKVGDRHIFTFPNLEQMLKLKWTNCLNFEHTAFLTEDITDYLLKKSGFKIIEKQYYGDPHSIFYATEKVENVSKDELQNNYLKYKKMFLDFTQYHLDMVRDINKKIEESESPVYLFGAHIFSQYLMAFGLNTNKIISVLDNSPIKQGKRLYGSNLYVESPTVIKGKGKVNLILKVAAYHDEIKEQILSINKEVTFW